MKKYDYIVAIDPDSDKSGIAWLNVEKRTIETATLEFPYLLERIESLTMLTNLCVIVEASWLNGHHNWHSNGADNRRVSSSKGYDIGRNHETGKKIVEMAKHYGLEVIECHPLKKGWRGPDGKITHDELAYFVPGLAKRTNQEQRDAALLAWYNAGLPIRVKPIATTIKPQH